MDNQSKSHLKLILLIGINILIYGTIILVIAKVVTEIKKVNKPASEQLKQVYQLTQ